MCKGPKSDDEKRDKLTRICLTLGKHDKNHKKSQFWLIGDSGSENWSDCKLLDRNFPIDDDCLLFQHTRENLFLKNFLSKMIIDDTFKLIVLPIVKFNTRILDERKFDSHSQGKEIKGGIFVINRYYGIKLFLGNWLSYKFSLRKSKGKIWDIRFQENFKKSESTKVK